jgi:Universal stress protein family
MCVKVTICVRANDGDSAGLAMLQCRPSGALLAVARRSAPLKGDISVYKRILIATDGSALAKKAEAMGLELAKTLNAEAIAVTVTEPAEALSMSALAERTMSNPIGNYEESVRAACGRCANRILGFSERPAQVAQNGVGKAPPRDLV